MPIEKGRPWGEPAPVPDELVMVRSDAEARLVLEAARRERRDYPGLGLLGGDLCRTLGGGAGDDLVGVRLTVDLGVALLDGRLHLFVAHLVARNRLWSRAFVAMNAQWCGEWDLGPRSHPGDGLLDTYDIHLSIGQVPAVRSRLPKGTHLPHPGIREQRAGAVLMNLDRRLPVRLDGLVVGKATKIVVRVEPAALVVYI